MKKIFLIIGLFLLGCAPYEKVSKLEYYTKQFECMYYCDEFYERDDCKNICLYLGEKTNENKEVK